jgi:hypothetical protein
VFLSLCAAHHDHAIPYNVTIQRLGQQFACLSTVGGRVHRLYPRPVHRTSSIVTGFYPSTPVFSCYSSVTKREIFCGMVRAIGGTVATSVLTLYSSSSSSCSGRIRFDSCSLYPQNEIGPSISSSFVLCAMQQKLQQRGEGAGESPAP